MTDLPTASSAEDASSDGEVSVPWVILTGLLIGLGLIGTAYWLVTLQWLYFLALAPLSIGAVLLFTRATGREHA